VRWQLQRSSGGGAIEVSLPLVEKERKAERHANQTGGRNRQPTASQAKAPALELDEENQGDGGQEDVEAEETAHPIGEQIGDEPAWCETMCGEPRPECGVGEAQAKDTEAEEEMT
jgi:hypothetical protein